MGLTTQQENIAKKIEGKYIVLAGAGSGKTFTLTQRIVRLINSGIHPDTITAVSFTKKASKEIKQRALNLSNNVNKVNFGTFHSICLQILNNYVDNLVEINLMNINKITVIDEKESKKLIIRNISSTKVDSNFVQSVISFSSYWNRKVVDPTYVKNVNAEVLEVWKKVQNEKREMGYVDFDDILKYTYILLSQLPDVRLIVSGKIHHLLVDEAQDLNEIQFELVKLLSSSWNNFMLVGDDLQSIYRFRGAKLDNFINLGKNDSAVEVLKLAQNFRSTKNIVDASNALIQLNKKQFDKTSYSEIPTTSLIKLYKFETKEEESAEVSDMLQRNMVNGTSPKDIAILFRNRKVSEQLERDLILKRIPYEIIGGKKFTDKRFVVQIRNLIRLIYNPYDELALEQCLLDLENVEEKSQRGLTLYSKHNNIILPKLVRSIEKIQSLPHSTRESIRYFWENFYVNISKYSSELNTIEVISDKINYCYKLMNMYPRKITDDECMLLDHLIHIFEGIVFQENIPFNSDLINIFNLISLSEDTIEKSDKNTVTLSTIHSAKGLEFKTVYLLGLESGTFPSFHAITDEEIDEERRLMYVAMTRAKENLILCYSKTKIFNGTRYENLTSQFLNEIPNQFIDFSNFV